jgi:membrane associated rhomboid family serine protease
MIPLYDENRSGQRPYVTWMLISINVIVFLWQISRGFLEEDFLQYGAIPYFIMQGQRLETLFTSMFMHGDILHIGGNMLYLYVFGDNIEDQFGHLKYMLLYFAFGLVGGVTNSFISVMEGDIGMSLPAVGASGAISGVLGAYLILFPNARIMTLILLRHITVVRIRAFYYLGFWFLYQFLMWFLNPLSGIAVWAHIGGFIVGAVAALAIKGRSTRRREYREY